MACRKGELKEAVPSSAAMTDALLFTTMCIIGLPVEVHARDGSVYSGIFHTASVDNDYAIVLKEARMTKKGNGDANVVVGSLIETLIVQSEDLVQVVAKGVPLPSNGVADGIQAIVGHNKCLDRDAIMIKTVSKGNKKHKSRVRFLAKRENTIACSSTVKTSNVFDRSLEEHNDRLDTKKFVKIEEAHKVSVDGRQVRDGSLEIRSDSQNEPKLQDERTTKEVRGSSLSIARCEAESTAAVDIPVRMSVQQTSTVVSSGSSVLKDQDQERPTSGEAACTETYPSNFSVASIPVGDVNSESSLYTSSNPFLSVPPKNSSFNRNAKESKLNPGAKTFSPSVLHNKPGTPVMVPNGASVPYMPEAYTVPPISTVQQDFDANSFANSSVPVKFVPYNNVVFGNAGSDTAYVQPIYGQLGSRTQHVRYDGQYHNLQTGPTYINPNSQNVMFRRVGPLVCMHPIANDVVQSAAGFAPAAPRPLLTPYQMQLPKYQGNISAQTLQLCTSPPIIANAPQPFVMPSSIPISQSFFPVLRPFAVPGSNGFMNTKFA